MIPLKAHRLSEASLLKLDQLQAEVDCVGREPILAQKSVRVSLRA